MRRALAAVIVWTGACGACGACSAGGGGDVDAGPAAWEARAPIPTGGRLEGAVAALDGKIVLVGGFDPSLAIVGTTSIYDPAEDRWSEGAPLPVARTHVNLVGAGGRLYALGGLEGPTFVPDGRCFAYDPAADAWSEIAPLPAGRERGAAAVGSIDGGGSVIVAGGAIADGVSAAVDVYEIDADGWSDRAPLPSARSHARGAVAGDTFLVIGGLLDRDGTIPTGELLAWDEAAGAWIARAPMPTARGGCAIGAIGDVVLCAGGEDGDDVVDTTEAYDAAADAWSELAPMLAKRGGTGGAVVDGRLYVPGGAHVYAYEPAASHEVWVGPPP